MSLLRHLLALLVLAALPAWGQATGTHAFELPPFFVDSFLDFRDDVRDAAKAGKRVMIYFGQDGCPYCRELLQNNFTQKSIVDKTRKHLVPIALNIWGDREVTWVDGKSTTEKELARQLKVQFTPTLLFLDERGQVVARINGYYPPNRFEAALDYVTQRRERNTSFADYMQTAVKEAASDTLHDEPFFLKPPHDLRRTQGAKPLAVLFETRHCAGCDELHKEGFRRPEIQALLPRFDIVRFSLADRSAITTPDGRKTTADAWARDLGIAYTPTMVFFESPSGREVFRLEAYLRPFHLAGSLDYVASGAYRSEPNFQRFLQARSERLREQGAAVDLWK